MKYRTNGSFFSSHSLRYKLLVMIIPILIVMFGVMLGINFVYQMRSGETTAANTLSLIDNQYANDIQRWLVQRQSQVTLTADNPMIQQNVIQIVANGPDALSARNAVTKYLQTILHNFPYFDEIYGLSPAGRVLFSTDPSRVGTIRPVDNLIKQPLEQGGVYFQDAYFANSTHVPSMAYAVAVKDPAGRPLAVLVFRVTISELLDSISQGESQLGQTGEIVLLRHDRTVINQPRGEPDFQLSFRSDAESAFLAVEGGQGIFRGLDHDNQSVIAAYNYVPYAKWGIVVQQDWAEIMQPVWRSTALITLPGLVGLALLILLVAFFISQTVAPLRDIVRVSAALNRGEFDQRALIGNREDEIGVLGRAFNEMATGLQKQFNLRDRLRHLLEVLVSTIHVGPLVTTSLATIARSHGMAVGAVYLKTEETNTLRLVATYCPSGRLSLEREHDLPADEGPGGQALSSCRPVVLENIPIDTVYTIKTISGEFLPTSIFHLPLIFGDQALGVMVLASTGKPEEDCLEQLQAASSLLSVSLHNSLMFDKVESLSEKLMRTNEELSITNEELQTQAEELRVQAEELYTKGRELSSANQQLEQATQMKSDFLARMSHELRTPLNTVIGFGEILLEGLFGDVNAKQQEYLNDILSSGRHLLSLINDILDLSKIEAGQEELSLRQNDPLESLQEAVVLTWPQAEHKQLQIDIGFFSGQYTVWADAEKLKQIFVNLLSNAVKFSPTGGRISATAKADGKQLAISLSDQGIGIAPELHQVIFEKFKQGTPRPDSTQQGTGLGLTITKKLVEMHGGRIWVDSSPGCGATFTFTVSLLDGYLAKTPNDNLLRDDAITKQYVILLVQNDPVAREFLCSYLDQDGYRVETAAGAEEAMEKVSIYRPWLIILDITLSGKDDGWELLGNLKSAEETKEIPVIIVSAVDETGRGLSMGALDIFVKPVDEKLLLSRLHTLKTTSTSVATVLVVDDDPKIVEYLAAVLESANYRVRRATNGREAIEMVVSTSPDVMILDLVMPELTGFDVLDELSGYPTARKVCIFVLTAKDLTMAEKDRLNSQVTAIARKGELSKEQFLAQLEKIRTMFIRKETTDEDPHH